MSGYRSGLTETVASRQYTEAVFAPALKVVEGLGRVCDAAAMAGLPVSVDGVLNAPRLARPAVQIKADDEARQLRRPSTADGTVALPTR
jgi:hypothetical protein